MIRNDSRKALLLNVSMKAAVIAVRLVAAENLEHLPRSQFQLNVVRRTVCFQRLRYAQHRLQFVARQQICKELTMY